MTREELIAKAEGLTRPDVSVDRMVAGYRGAPSYTRSVDAVLALIQERLPGCGWQITFDPSAPLRPFIGKIFIPPVDPDALITDVRSWSEHILGAGHAAAPALLSAYLRADAATPAAREGEEAARAAGIPVRELEG